MQMLMNIDICKEMLSSRTFKFVLPLSYFIFYFIYLFIYLFIYNNL